MRFWPTSSRSAWCWCPPPWPRPPPSSWSSRSPSSPPTSPSVTRAGKVGRIGNVDVTKVTMSRRPVHPRRHRQGLGGGLQRGDGAGPGAAHHRAGAGWLDISRYLYLEISTPYLQVAWIWALGFAFSVPQLLAFLRSLRKCLFKFNNLPTLKDRVPRFWHQTVMNEYNILALFKESTAGIIQM